MSRAPIKVLTMNVHKGFSLFNRKFVLQELREAVRATHADIVFLQEVLGSHAILAKRFPQWSTVPQYEYLADTLWCNYAYGRNAVYPDGDHGNAILSKFIIQRHDNHFLAHVGERRGILHAVLGTPLARETHVMCVHFGLSEAERSEQTQLLCALIEKAVPPGAPLIVAGDFNDWRLRVHDKLMQWGLHEVFVQAHGEAARTFPSRWPLLRLDRIYVRNADAHAPVVLPRKPWSHLSDHAPLAAEIEL